MADIVGLDGRPLVDDLTAKMCLGCGGQAERVMTSRMGTPQYSIELRHGVCGACERTWPPAVLAVKAFAIQTIVLTDPTGEAEAEPGTVH